MKCFWTPQIRPSKRVSTMFFDTTCGRLSVPTFTDSEWKYCPYCAHEIAWAKTLQEARIRPEDAYT